MITIFGVGLEDWSYMATMLSAVGAAGAFALNVRSQISQRSIDNCIRYLGYHSRLFSEDGYLRTNVKAMEAGTFRRDVANEPMENKFREMLAEFEKLALLHKAGGAPTSINAYMLGFFTKQICPVLTDKEKAEPYWELAIDFIREIKKDAERLDNFNKSERLKYISRNHF